MARATAPPTSTSISMPTTQEILERHPRLKLVQEQEVLQAQQLRVTGRSAGRAAAYESDPVSEKELIRDVLYAFQGISGKYVRLETNQFHISRTHATTSTCSLVIRLCELGVHFLSVNNFVTRTKQGGSSLTALVASAYMHLSHWCSGLCRWASRGTFRLLSLCSCPGGAGDLKNS